MCGISVVITLHGTSLDNGMQSIQDQLNESLDRISHRGPDSRGVWVNDDQTVGIETFHGHGQNEAGLTK